jgi:NhaP-type Na+/H+ or K+/H+ antiporter
MTWGGLRGAVAFYLALKMNSEYKNLIITTTISLIVFTIIGLGSTTKLMITYLIHLFPEDNLLDTEEVTLPLKEMNSEDSNGDNHNHKNIR